jgi:hypothetical protein
METPVKRIELCPGHRQVRLVGKYVKFHRLHRPDGLIIHPSFENVWQERERREKPLPVECFAVHVIDRADGQLKILEGDRQLFSQFAKYNAENSADPSGKNGPDFVIHVDERNAATANALKETALSEAEVEMIGRDSWQFTKLYSSVSEEAALFAVAASFSTSLRDHNHVYVWHDSAALLACVDSKQTDWTPISLN